MSQSEKVAASKCVYSSLNPPLTSFRQKKRKKGKTGKGEKARGAKKWRKVEQTPRSLHLHFWALRAQFLISYNRVVVADADGTVVVVAVVVVAAVIVVVSSLNRTGEKIFALFFATKQIGYEIEKEEGIG